MSLKTFNQFNEEDIEDLKESVKMFLFYEDYFEERIPQNQNFHEIFLDEVAESVFG